MLSIKFRVVCVVFTCGDNYCLRCTFHVAIAEVVVLCSVVVSDEVRNYGVQVCAIQNVIFGSFI